MRMVHIAGFCVGRNDKHRETKAQTVVIEHLRWSGIEPAAVIVPEDKYGGIVPVLGFSDRVDQRCDPRGTGKRVGTGMIGVRKGRRYPAKVAQFAGLHVIEKPRLRTDDVLGPIRTVKDGANVLIRAPNAA